MVRLIDADKIPTVSWDKIEEEAFRQTIAEQPTVDAEPIIETTLIIREMGSIEECRCSKCRMVWLWSGDLFIFKYCPNCGARVVGKRYKKERKEE